MHSAKASLRQRGGPGGGGGGSGGCRRLAALERRRRLHAGTPAWGAPSRCRKVRSAPNYGWGCGAELDGGGGGERRASKRYDERSARQGTRKARSGQTGALRGAGGAVPLCVHERGMSRKTGKDGALWCARHFIEDVYESHTTERVHPGSKALGRRAHAMHAVCIRHELQAKPRADGGAVSSQSSAVRAVRAVCV